MVPCDNVPDEGNSKRWPTENSVTCGTKVRYTCNQGLTLEGDILECGVGGQMQGQVPVCKKPGKLYLIMLLFCLSGVEILNLKTLI